MSSDGGRPSASSRVRPLAIDIQSRPLGQPGTLREEKIAGGENCAARNAEKHTPAGNVHVPYSLSYVMPLLPSVCTTFVPCGGVHRGSDGAAVYLYRRSSFHGLLEA